MVVSKAFQLAVIALSALAVYAFVTTARDAEARRACSPLCAIRPNYAALNRTAPDFELDRYGGGRLRLSELSGKTVVLNFWSSSCPPCLEEMPSLARLAHSLRSVDSAVLLTVSTDETLETVEDTLRSVLGSERPFIVLWDPESKVVADKFGTKLFPETWLIDANGVIRARVDGARDWSSILVLDLVKSLSDPLGCDVGFSRGRAYGPMASLCESIPPA